MNQNDITGIYFLIDESDEIVYVGQSEDIGKRVAAHANKGMKLWTHSFFLPCKASQIDEVEAYYVLRLKPKYNKRVPKNRIIHRVPHIVNFRDRIYQYDPYVVGAVIAQSVQGEARLEPKFKELLKEQEEKAVREAGQYGRVIYKLGGRR